jgi:hypothetical protein
MALDYSQLQSITQEFIVPKLVDNVFNKYSILERLRKRLNKVQDGGEYIKQPIIYAKKTSVGTYDGWDTVLTAVNDSLNAVTFNWGHYYCNMGISKTDELANYGKQKIISLLTAEGQVAELTLADTMTTDLFASGAVTNGFDGFVQMIGTTGEFGGISSSDTSVWASSVDSSSTVMTLGALQGKFGDVTYGQETPTLIISNQDCFDKYWQLLEVKPEFRVQDKNGSLKFRSADWIVDKACGGTGSGTADNQILFINENFVEFYVHPADNFKVGDWMKPINQEGRICRITFTGQLGTSNRRMHGKFTTINPAL